MRTARPTGGSRTITELLPHRRSGSSMIDLTSWPAISPAGHELRARERVRTATGSRRGSVTGPWQARGRLTTGPTLRRFIDRPIRSRRAVLDTLDMHRWRGAIGSAPVL